MKIKIDLIIFITSLRRFPHTTAATSKTKLEGWHVDNLKKIWWLRSLWTEPEYLDKVNFNLSKLGFTLSCTCYNTVQYTRYVVHGMVKYWNIAWVIIMAGERREIQLLAATLPDLVARDWLDNSTLLLLNFWFVFEEAAPWVFFQPGTWDIQTFKAGKAFWKYTSPCWKIVLL